MGQQLNVYSKLKALAVGVKKLFLVICIRPETKWANHEQDEAAVKGGGGLNPDMWKYVGMTCG